MDTINIGGLPVRRTVVGAFGRLELDITQSVLANDRHRTLSESLNDLEFLRAELNRIEAQRDDLVDYLSGLIGGWKRQKDLFPVLDRDGWMDLSVAECERYLANVEGR